MNLTTSTSMQAAHLKSRLPLLRGYNIFMVEEGLYHSFNVTAFWSYHMASTFLSNLGFLCDGKGITSIQRCPKEVSSAPSKDLIGFVAE